MPAFGRMNVSSLALAILWCRIAIVTAAGDCSIPPAVFTLKNYTLGGANFEQRGLYLSLGGQAGALRVSTLYNNSNIRSSLDCAGGSSSANALCVSYSGGVVDTSKIEGWRYAPPDQWNVSAVDGLSPGQRAVQGRAPVQFETGPVKPDFPLRVSSYANQDFNYSQISIGPSSNFLDWLVDSRFAPSRSVGLYFGSRSQLHPADGTMLVGGYDESLLAGDWFNFTAGDQFLGGSACPLQVLIKNVRLSNINGTSSLLNDSRLGVPACVDPLQNSFSLTPTLFQKYMDLAGWDGAVSPRVEAPTFPVSAAPLLGNLTIEMSNGMTVDIPSYELVSQERGPNDQGTYAVTNASRLQLAISTTNTRLPSLGGVFLSQVYMHIQWEKRMFSLAPAAVGARKSPENIVTVCESNSASNASSNRSPENGGGSSGGVVGPAVGGSVGGVFVLALILALIWYIHKRRHSDVSSQPSDVSKGEILRGPRSPSDIHLANRVGNGRSPYGQDPAAEAGVSRFVARRCCKRCDANRHPHS